MLLSRAWWPPAVEGGTQGVGAVPAQASVPVAPPPAPASPRDGGVRYTAILLDAASREVLLRRVPPAFAHVTADHVALEHAPGAAALAKLPMGATALLAATGVVQAGGVQAATIKALPTWLVHAIEPGAPPHVTVSADAPALGAAEAGTVVATALAAGSAGTATTTTTTRLVPPVGLRGTVGVIVKDGSRHTSWAGDGEAMPAAWRATGPPPRRRPVELDDSATSSSADGDAASAAAARKLGRNGRMAAKFKTIFCRTWAAGQACPYGKDCLYAHGEDDLRPDPTQPGRPVSRSSLVQAAYARQARFEAAVGKGVVGGRTALEARLKQLAAAAGGDGGGAPAAVVATASATAVVTGATLPQAAAAPAGGGRATRSRRGGRPGSSCGGADAATPVGGARDGLLLSPGALATRREAAAAALRAATAEVDRCERAIARAMAKPSGAGGQLSAAALGRAAWAAVAAAATAKAAKLEAEHWANLKNGHVCSASAARKRGRAAAAAAAAAEASVAGAMGAAAAARAAAATAALTAADPSPGAAAKAATTLASLEAQHYHNIKNRCGQLARNARLRGEADAAAKLTAAAAAADAMATAARGGRLSKAAAAKQADAEAQRVSCSENGDDGGDGVAAANRRTAATTTTTRVGGAAGRTVLAPVLTAGPPPPPPGLTPSPATSMAAGLDGDMSRAQAVQAAARCHTSSRA